MKRLLSRTGTENVLFIGLILAALLLTIFGGRVFGQDTSDPPAEPVGELVMRNTDGTVTGVTQVVRSTQYQAMIEKVAAVEAQLEAMNETLAEVGGKVDYLVTQHAAGQIPAPEPDAININTATFEELQTIPGIGAVKAGSIVAERGERGVFSSWDGLARRVRGVGPATVADIQASGRAVIEPVDPPDDGQ